MRARTVNENYPPGAANDPNAPWNEPEDDSQYDVDFGADGIEISRKYNFSYDDYDEDQGSVDMETLQSYAGKELGVDPEEKYENDEYMEISGMADSQKGIMFQTTWGDFEISMDELIDMTNLF